ncbi:MAG: glycosyltransferase [Candidatus Aminicenantes bacterium]|nr:glycosyltransferase [Candidatus Aminicenantes bacterium]
MFDHINFVKKRPFFLEKKLLLVIHPFAPLSGPRSLRWLNLTKILSLSGWNVDVLTIDPSKNDALHDDSLTYMVHKMVNVHRTYPGLLYTWSHRKIKAKNSFLKTTSEWLPFGLIQGMRIIRKQRPALIVSSALPFVGHMIGFILKKIYGIPWVADYGDSIGFNPITTRLKRGIGSIIEGRILRSADGLIVNFEEMRKEFLRTYPFLKQKPSKVIFHGVDESFKDVQPRKTPYTFVMVHTGSFYRGHREPDIFFQALSRLAEDPAFARESLFVVAGNIDAETKRVAQRLGINHLVRFTGYIPFTHSVALVKGASVLIYFGGKEGYFQFQSKIFEYAAAGRPILAVKQSETDMGPAYVERNELGEVVPNEKEALCEALEKLYGLWKNNKLDESYSRMDEDSLYWDNRGKNLDWFLSKKILKIK